MCHVYLSILGKGEKAACPLRRKSHILLATLSVTADKMLFYMNNIQTYNQGYHASYYIHRKYLVKLDFFFCGGWGEEGGHWQGCYTLDQRSIILEEQ